MSKPKTVGAFTYHPDGSIEGPAQYLEEKGNDTIEKINAGKNHVFNFGCRNPNADTVTLLLVALQTDYAGWLGMKGLVKK